MNKVLYLTLLLLVLANNQVIRVPTVTPTSPTVSLRTQPAFLYHGTVDIQITNGEQDNLDFYVQLAPQKQCKWAKCFNGWVSNYTKKGSDPVQGYPNGKLQVFPTFTFNTNSEQDFQLIRSHKLDEVWAQIIQVACQKLNPQLVQNSSLNQKSFILNQGSSAPKYAFASPNLDKSSFAFGNQNNVASSFSNFNQNPTFRVLEPTKGDLIAISSRLLQVQGVAIRSSELGEQVLLNSDLVVKQRLVNYNLELKSDNPKTEQGVDAPSFAGRILVGLNLVESANILVSTVAKAKSATSSLNPQDDRYSYEDIENRRLDFGNHFASEDAQVDISPDVQQTFQNQVFSGVDVAQMFNNGGIKTQSSASYQPPNTRLLQLLATYTIYNYNKVLFSKTIFGKLFQVTVDVKCYLLVYPSDHKIQCTGTLKYDLFGNSKSVTIFNFIKSVSFAWNQNYQYKGKWGFTVYIPLPPPVSFLGINFAFQISYVIDINLSANNFPGPPYKIVVGAVATTSVNTDASAALRAVVIEGGVFITGTLVKLKTDPTLALSYYWVNKKITILAQWFFEINAFQYDWGFFYRTWGLFSGWSGKKIIAKWTIKGLYAKYTIINKTWNIYF